ncbi:GntR family transcriptional regulator [Herminiimonas sp. NPDC097707]|uniref:GntR family transcriptional regulator n=1 Tax=Herminiimonas sp. NPDC097707 TaxID=3364007 RepID=UPI00383A53EA
MSINHTSSKVVPAGSDFTPVRQPLRSPRPSVASSSERAYLRIEEAIVTMEIQPGSDVNEAFLSEVAGFGRTPVREAVRKLCFEHLLVVKPKRGIYVTEIDPVAQLRLLEVRREIDRLVFQNAARRATPEQRRQFVLLGENFRRSAEAADKMLFIRCDKEFNELCLNCARNEFLTGSLRSIQGLSRRFWFCHYKTYDYLSVTALLHAGVAEAIADGKVNLVTEATERLVDSAEALARKVADQEGVLADHETMQSDLSAH